MLAIGHPEIPVTRLAGQGLFDDHMIVRRIRTVDGVIDRSEYRNRSHTGGDRHMQRSAVIDYGKFALRKKSCELADRSLTDGQKRSILHHGHDLSAQIALFFI